MSEMAKERAEPPEPEPVVIDGVRYEALLWGKARGLGQNGGLIEAFDNRSGDSLWVLKVYDIDYDVDMEGDKLDLFIEELAAEGPEALRVVTERGGRYRIDLRDRSVRAITN
ncbi:hypothetical protein [Pararhodobacter sp. SW119]|uniref:hypothetical protein n=1 Tax=Pararhodobacter sp. SW119 TaxID=2780075 RepID=UPI001AE0E74B|nr:hypothetical protein [Pararhodobacter sp. SW119]